MTGINRSGAYCAKVCSAALSLESTCCWATTKAFLALASFVSAASAASMASCDEPKSEKGRERGKEKENQDLVRKGKKKTQERGEENI
jgi:hypothetical protein